VIAEQRAAENAIELARSQQTEASDSFSTIQAEFYRIGGEVARTEQTIEHTRDTRRQRSQELVEVEKNLNESMTHFQDDTARIAQIAASIDTDQPAFNLLQDSQKASAEHLLRAETEVQEWQQRNDAFNSRFSETTQVARVETSRIEQFERSVGNADVRLQRLSEEHTTLDLEPLRSSIEQLVARELEAAEEEQQLKQSLELTSNKQRSQKASIAECRAELDTIKSSQQTGLGRLASLEALQQAALENDTGEADAWLASGSGLCQQ